jgi:hypothetical protein
VSGFSNPIIGGGGDLVFPDIQSPNYLTGVSGWRVNKDGTAEFQNIILPSGSGGAVIYITDIAPVGANIGDLWFDSSNGYLLNQWNGSAWIPAALGTNAIAAGAITSGQIAAGAIVAGLIAAGAIDGTTINGMTINGNIITAADVIISAGDGGLFVYSSGGPIVKTFTSSGTWTAPTGVTAVSAECWGGGAGGSTAGATVTVVTKTVNGSGTIPIPAGVTSVKAECWGAGGSGGAPLNAGGGGAEGGEYACEPNLAVTPSSNLPYTVGLGANTQNQGGNSTVTGSAKTVTAHGGLSNNGSGGISGGAKGSTNTIHYNGGGGRYAGAGGGGGGGSSAGTSAAGTQGSGGLVHFGGAGGVAPSGGGNGGAGGNDYVVSPPHGTAGVNGSAPGGGGGGAPNSAPGSGNGADGQVRITYSTGGGGGGGEYAAELSGTCTPGNVYTVTIGAAGAAGAAGGNTTFSGTGTTTVTAHGGSSSGSGQPGGAGGTGSTNSTKHPGGSGGASGGTANPAGGGGGSGGSGATGNAGGAGPTGVGGTAVAGGGPGWAWNAVGGAPGGGGGGDIKAGAAGKVVLTYTTPATLSGSIAGLAGTDPLAGTAYPEGAKFDNLEVVNRLQLDNASAPANPTAALAAYADVNSHMRYKDPAGNIHAAGTITSRTTATQAVTSSTPITIPGLTITLGVGNWIVDAWIDLTGNSATWTGYLYLSGTATVSNFAGHVLTVGNGVATTYKRQPTFGTNTNVNFGIALNVDYLCHVQSYITVTAAGTVQIGAASSNTGTPSNAFTTQIGSIIEARSV